MLRASLLCSSTSISFTPIQLLNPNTSHRFLSFELARHVSAFSHTKCHFSLVKARGKSSFLVRSTATHEAVETSSSSSTSGLDLVEVGFLSGVHGLQGEICIKPNTDFPDLRFSKVIKGWDQGIIGSDPMLTVPITMCSTTGLNPLSFRTHHLKLLSCYTDSTPPSIIAQKLIKDSKLYGDFSRKIQIIDYAPLIKTLSKRRLPDVAHEIFIQTKSNNLLPNYRTLSALMLCFAENGFVLQARMVWDEMLNSCFVPDLFLISNLISAYEQVGCFDEIANITKEIGARHCKLVPVVYSLAISCFGENGQLKLMEDTIAELDSYGILLDSRTTVKAVVRYYSVFGSLEKMEQAYGRLKKFGIVIDEKEIRAVLLAYLKQSKFYRMREFLSDVGLGRRDLGNLLWNSVLLSYAADFKMKSLQKEFIRMLDAGFSPDITTFNIRALAFSRMSLFWDLHITLEHMRHLNIVPDLVTFGCVVDAYVDRRLAGNLEFVYNRMNLDDSPVVLTDSLVFEVMGKGDFHLSSEALLEFSLRKQWSYRKLIQVYLKKKLRRDQIFWNY